MQATHSLPPHYRQRGAMNLSQQPRLFLLLNLLGLVVLVLAALLFPWLASLVRPQAVSDLLQQFAAGFNAGSALLMLVLVMVVMVVVHEAIHGLFFWLFTRARPRFGLGMGYAYASAPGWYLPRNQYLVVGIAPLVVISVMGLVLLAVAPANWVAPLLGLMVMNASGAVGDMAVVAWLLSMPRETLASDDGDAVTVFTPQTESEAA